MHVHVASGGRRSGIFGSTFPESVAHEGKADILVGPTTGKHRYIKPEREQECEPFEHAGQSSAPAKNHTFRGQYRRDGLHQLEI